MTIYGSPWDKKVFSEKQAEYDKKLFDQWHIISELRYRESREKLKKMGINLKELDEFLKSDNKPEFHIPGHLKEKVSKHLQDIRLHENLKLTNILLFKDVEEFIVVWRIMTEILNIPDEQLEYELDVLASYGEVGFKIVRYQK